VQFLDPSHANTEITYGRAALEAAHAAVKVDLVAPEDLVVTAVGIPIDKQRPDQGDQQHEGATAA